MENSSSRYRKRLLSKTLFTEFYIRHHNNNKHEINPSITKTRLILANQKTQITHGPFFTFSFFRFFFNLVLSFFVFFFSFSIFFLVLVFFLLRVHRRETGWDNSFFSFLSRANGNTGDM